MTSISRAALDLLESYPWPGNVRELQHAMERAVVLTRNEVLGPDEILAMMHGRASVGCPGCHVARALFVLRRRDDESATHQFWSALASVYRAFETTRRVPVVTVDRDGVYRVK